MTQWNVTFTGPDKTSITRHIEADTWNGAVDAARAALHYPWMWTLSGAVAAMSAENAAKIAAWVTQRDAEDEERELDDDRERESAATFNGG